jgi:hypothetical protein
MTFSAKIERLDNGYLLHLDDGEVIQHLAFAVDDSPDGLKDGLLNMLSDIVEFFGEQGSKHDQIRPLICYRAGDISEKELTELRKKTGWEIVP